MPRHSISFTFLQNGFPGWPHEKNKAHLQEADGAVQIRFTECSQINNWEWAAIPLFFFKGVPQNHLVEKQTSRITYIQWHYKNKKRSCRNSCFCARQWRAGLPELPVRWIVQGGFLTGFDNLGTGARGVSSCFLITAPPDSPFTQQKYKHNSFAFFVSVFALIC